MSVYRNEIDGLRAIAVLSVILFHLGIFANGYLGVDVFFVISGFLITKIIYNETVERRFSIVNFYLRRIRRIIPLVLFINLIALIIGIGVMLPSDLMDLGQSVVATNFFSNNILGFKLTKDYWDISNEFKPLMHTWTLGIEEQFYLFYPLIFIFLGRKRLKLILPVIVTLSLISLFFYFISSSEQAKFYLIQYRFFELALGGIGAIIVKKKLFEIRYSIIFILLLLAVLFSNIAPIQHLNLFLVLLATLGLLITSIEKNKISSLLLENKLMVGIGKISFSLYMWHQLILAFGRYFIIEEASWGSSLIMVGVTFLASFLTYFFIEQPFRNKNRIKNKVLWITLSTLFVLTTGTGAYLHFKSGVLKDVPELGIKQSETYVNTEIAYNSRVYKLFEGKSSFTDTEKSKILVIGNSFARDWINMLLESEYKKSIDIVYVYAPGPYAKYVDDTQNIKDLWNNADYVFFSIIPKPELDSIVKKHSFDESKAYVIGIKNFGLNNGRFYHRKGEIGYCYQTAKPRIGYVENNEKNITIFGNKYVDIMGMILNDEGRVPVFSNECKFISQDGVHLTESGAKFLGGLLTKNQKFSLD